MKDLTLIKEQLQAFVNAYDDSITIEGDTLTEFFKSIDSDSLDYYKSDENRARKFNSIFNNELVVENGKLLCNCSNDDTVVIPNNVTMIGSHAFISCKNLKLVIIPDSVIAIGHHAFKNCRNLIYVKLPNSIRTIERGLFYNCRNLTTITIPKSVISIDKDAFRNCLGPFIIER